MEMRFDAKAMTICCKAMSGAVLNILYTTLQSFQTRIGMLHGILQEPYATLQDVYAEIGMLHAILRMPYALTRMFFASLQVHYVYRRKVNLHDYPGDVIFTLSLARISPDFSGKDTR